MDRNDVSWIQHGFLALSAHKPFQRAVGAYLLGPPTDTV